jgi:hypothetical protein
LHSELVKQIVSSVFPGSVVMEGLPAGERGESFFVIPGKHGPRWIVPGNASYGRVFLEQWQPYDLSSRLKWRIVLIAYRLGLLSRLPGINTIFVAGAEQSWDGVGWGLTEPPVPVIYVGTPGSTRKAVVGLVESRTRKLRTIAKIPVSPGSVATIQHEMAMLSKLALQKPDFAPRVVYANSETGITVQEAFAGVPTSRRLMRHHIDWLSELNIGDESICLQDIATDVAMQVEQLVVIDPEVRELIAAVCRQLDDRTSLPAVWVHGDFAPWNLKMTNDGRLVAVDWEYSFPNGLPLFDIVYFRSIQMYLFGEKELFPRNALTLAFSYLKLLGVAPSSFEPLVLACLMQDWLRSFIRGDDERAEFLLLQIKTRMRGIS